MYRRINPTSRQELPIRMLYQPLGDGTFHRACEADSFRALVGALLDDPTYEHSSVEERLMARLRLADDIVLLLQVAGDPPVGISDRPGDRTVNVSSDEPFIRSLEQLGFLSVAA